MLRWPGRFESLRVGYVAESHGEEKRSLGMSECSYRARCPADVASRVFRWGSDPLLA